MLTIICGEDSVSSRNYYKQLKLQKRQGGEEIRELVPTKLSEIPLWLSESTSLFFRRMAVFTEHLNKHVSKRGNPHYVALIEKLAADKNVEIIDWEEFLPRRNLKISARVTVKEFKSPQSVFTLLDNCYPGNLKQFITQLHTLPKKIDEFFIFSMLVRHIRNMVLVKTSRNTGTLQSWQIARLKAQARFWNIEDLIHFYDSLYRIDASTKSSMTPFSITESLDIITCYFL